MARTKVYYNGACPVCAAGIRQQRRKLADSECQVDWIDVHADNAAVGQIGRDLEFVRERLHVVDDAGRLRVGVEAFAALWTITPGQGWLARASHLPLLRTLLRWAYNGFAAALYRWNRWHGRW